MISDDAYRRLEAVGKQLMHSGDITPQGLRVLYSVLVEETEKGQQEALREHSRLAQVVEADRAALDVEE